MLTQAMDAGLIPDLLKRLSADLKFIFQEANIPKDVQAKIASLGYTTREVFSKVEDSQAELRNFIKSDIGIDPKASPDHRNLVSKILVAWESASKRVDKLQTEEAEQRAADVPRTIPKQSHLFVKQNFEEMHGQMKSGLHPVWLFAPLWAYAYAGC